MRTLIQPVAQQLGITKRISWHVFRHTFSTLLKANREDVKVVQELLRHASSRMTLDTYTQALGADKRAAQNVIARSRTRTDARASGLRRGELAGLRWGDFDFQNLTVAVTRSLVDQQEFVDKNPITGPVKGAGVRVSSKREREPEVHKVVKMIRPDDCVFSVYRENQSFSA